MLGVKVELCMCIIDWENSFDRFDWRKPLEVLRGIEVKWRERRLIRNLLMG
jgi:hypothetical protein